jgi:glyoxylase-like metal-dependent hydrolase (beta-lactamase superfamily II)
MYALTGAGGNTTVAVGSDSIIVVDTQFAPVYDKIKAKIASLSPLPVKYVILTHYHGDHTGGNASFAKDGATLVSTAKLADRLQHPLPQANGQPGTPAPDEAVPKQTFSGQSYELKTGGVTATFYHPAAAHTDTDAIIFWPAANVISTGDIVSSASYPNIDVACPDQDRARPWPGHRPHWSAGLSHHAGHGAGTHRQGQGGRSDRRSGRQWHAAGRSGHEMETAGQHRAIAVPAPGLSIRQIGGKQAGM